MNCLQLKIFFLMFSALSSSILFGANNSSVPQLKSVRAVAITPSNLEAENKKLRDQLLQCGIAKRAAEHGARLAEELYMIYQGQMKPAGAWAALKRAQEKFPHIKPAPPAFSLTASSSSAPASHSSTASSAAAAAAKSSS